jgi:hypothetical protein
MKKTFPGFYRPTPTEFSKLWQECIFTIDANVLLNLYRYSSRARGELIEILNQISDRLWVPHQAAFEYQSRRLDVISSQAEAYQKIRD